MASEDFQQSVHANDDPFVEDVGLAHVVVDDGWNLGNLGSLVFIFTDQFLLQFSAFFGLFFFLAGQNLLDDLF